MHVGDRIATYRKRRGMSQEALAGGLTPDLGHAESRIGAGESEMIHNHGQEELLR